MKHSTMTSALFPATSSRASQKKTSSLSQSKSIFPTLFDLAPVVDIDVAADCGESEPAFTAQEPELPTVFQAVAVNFDGEENIIYVEADSEGEAEELASDMFASQGVCIYQLFLYAVA